MNLEFKQSSLENSNNLLLYNNGIQIGFVDEYVNRKEDYALIIDFLYISQFFDTDLDNLFELYKNQISQISLRLNFNDYTFLNWIKEDARLTFLEDNTCSLYVDIDFQNWNKPFTMGSFLKKLQDKINTDEFISFEFDEYGDFFEFGLNFFFSIKEESRNIGNLYQKILNHFNQINQEVFLELTNELKDNSLLVNFLFPEDIQSSCEQYLIYFSKFLADLGINATTEIKSESKNTLFTVIPNDTNEALHIIRDALNVYLNLPNAKDLEIISHDYKDISVQQLVANIYHLKSQLMLANSTIQLKDSTIEMLKITNYQISLMPEKKENEEKILGGVASVDEFEWKGFKLNIAEIFRRMKRLKR